jgi:hypothetical protein
MKKNSPLLLLILFFLVLCQNGMGQISSGEIAFNAIPPHTYMHFGGSTFTAGLNGTTASDNLNPSTLTIGVVSYWTLDETSGNAIDVAGGGNNGTLTSTTQGVTGIINKAYSFNGTSSKVDMGNPANLSLTTAGSLSCWVYASGNPSDGIVVSKGNFSADTYGYGIDYLGAGKVFDAELASGTKHQTLTFGSPVLNTWNHLVITWDGTTLKGYINGVVTSVPQTVVPVSNVNDFVLGYNYATSGAYFNGRIDEVGVWSRALTASEVTSLYSSGAGNQYPFTGPNSPPTANAGTDQVLPYGSTSTTLNGTGSDIDGTVAGYAWTQTAGAGGVTINPQTSATTGTTNISGLTSGSYTFKLTVTDNLGATGTSSINVTVNSAGIVWSATGNAGTVDGTNFIGTTDDVPLSFRVNNVAAGRIDPTYENTFYGYQSGASNTTGQVNTAYGAEALSGNLSGFWNTAIGKEALWQSNGTNNTAVGGQALLFNQTGSNLTAIGSGADVYGLGGPYNNSTALGFEATITASNQVVLGNTSVTGIYAQVTGITSLSDSRFKKNIKEDVPGLEFIKLLRPVTYYYDIKGFNTHIRGSIPAASQIPGADSAMGKALPKMHTLQPSKEDEAGIAQKEKIQYTGLVAQEVETAANKVGYDFSGLHKPQNDKDTYGLNYTEFVVPLIKSVQELSSSNEDLRNQVNDLQSQLNEIKVKFESLVKGGISSGSTTLSSAKLEQNIPNPFNQTTLINYYVPETAGHAFIKVTGINGEAIKIIQLNGTGSGQITLQTATLASGNYTYSLYVDGNLIDTKVMVLEK